MSGDGEHGIIKMRWYIRLFDNMPITYIML